MIETKTNKTKRSRWLDWQPKRPIKEDLPAEGPTKPSKLGSVGFVGAPPAEISINKDHIPERELQLDEDARRMISRMPPGVRVVSWHLEQPPIRIDACSLVTDPYAFARTTLAQLRATHASPKRWVGWSVPQLLYRLEQVGVIVKIEDDP